MKLNEENKLHIKEQALKEAPNECCGLIIDDGRQLKIIKCKNNSNNKREHFEISSSDFLSASREGKIMGYYHSHTEENQDFSYVDKAISSAHKLPLVMYFIKGDEFFYHLP
tara:strand:- start:513 stop:845 length:333 start_codon:yes stop_codon:yes gene_type:complete